MTNLEIASEVVRAATGKNVELAIVDRGFKVADSYTVTRGDAKRIEAGFRSHKICARVNPGRWVKIWIKPEDR